MTTLRVTLEITLYVDQSTWNQDTCMDDGPMTIGDDWCNEAAMALHGIHKRVQVASVKPKTAVLIPESEALAAVL